MPAPSEYQIQKALCMWLDGVPGQFLPALLPDVVYFHPPNGGFRNPLEAKRLKDTGVKAGIFDLVFFHRGAFHLLELKDEKGKLSKSQHDMWPRLVTAGARGIAWANNLADAKTWIQSWGLTRG